MSFILLGILNSQAAGGVSVSYYLQTIDLSGVSGTTRFKHLTKDNDGNLIISGSVDDDESIIYKTDVDGTVLDRDCIESPVPFISSFENTFVDSSNNYYALGYRDRNDSSQFNGTFIEYNSSLARQSTKLASTTIGNNFEDYRRGAIDGSNNIFSAFRIDNTSTLLKQTTSGSLSFARRYDIGISNEVLDVALDSSGNIYLVGEAGGLDSGGTAMTVAKYNSSGTAQWFRHTIISSSNDNGQAIAIDSSDNIYIVGGTESTPYRFNIIKLDTSGNITWSRSLETFNDTTSSALAGIAIDSQDNIYFAGTYNNDRGLLAKLDSSGNLQWARRMRDSAFARDVDLNNIFVDENDTVYAVGTYNANGFVMKVPNDGSLTGTYSIDGRSLVYEAHTDTFATESYTLDSFSPSTSTPSVGISDGFMTDVSITETTDTVTIG